METSRWAEARHEAVQNAAGAIVTPQAPEAEAEQPIHESAPPAPQEISYASNDNIDEFAQTISQDDLFGDDFTPIAEPTVEEVIPPQPEEAHQQPSKEQRLRGRGALRGRGGRGRVANTNQPRQQPQKQEAVASEAVTDTPMNVNGNKAPTGPKSEPVRGDRHLSGGLARTRLTEDELNARLEAIKLKNASLEAAHARAAADEAHFQAREAEAEVQRKKERKERQVMMNDRERNRIRKLNAQQGREWDATKEDDDGNEAKSRGSGYRRGAHGGISGFAPTSESTERLEERDNSSEQYMWHEDSPNRGRGRGRGRGGRARGGTYGREGIQQGPKQELPSAEDFPALETTTKASEEPKPSNWPVQANPGASWADDMESPVVPNENAKR